MHPTIHIVSGMFRPVMLCNFCICKRCQALASNWTKMHWTVTGLMIVM